MGHMQMCTSPQKDNHASTPPLNFFYRLNALPATQPTASKHWRHFPSEAKTFSERGTGPSPDSSFGDEGKNTEIKHNNQYNFRLQESAKIAPRMHQNVPFSSQKSKVSNITVVLLPTGSPKTVHNRCRKNLQSYQPLECNMVLLTKYVSARFSDNLA